MGYVPIYMEDQKELLLREDRRLLGRLLGEVIREQVGPEMLERVELRLELGLHRRRLAGERRVGLGAPEAHRGLAEGFDAAADPLADLLGDHVAEQPAEQAPVLAQQMLLLLAGR